MEFDIRIKVNEILGDEASVDENGTEAYLEETTGDFPMSAKEIEELKEAILTTLNVTTFYTGDWEDSVNVRVFSAKVAFIRPHD